MEPDENRGGAGGDGARHVAVASSPILAMPLEVDVQPDRLLQLVRLLCLSERYLRLLLPTPMALVLMVIVLRAACSLPFYCNQNKRPRCWLTINRVARSR
jgi:hypothetical protein